MLHAAGGRSVASQTLYENAYRFELVEPSGILPTENARYEAILGLDVSD